MLVYSDTPNPADPKRALMRRYYRADEAETVDRLLMAADIPAHLQDRISETARTLVLGARKARAHQGGLDAFLHQYELTSKEGVVLMCLAEALLRIPDSDTANLLIKDKLSDANWEEHLGESDSLFVNASTWALMLTGRIISLDREGTDLSSTLRRLVARSGEPVIRQAIMQAMRVMGRQFVMGRTIEEALDRAKAMEKKGYRYSYDMLGEAARTDADAQRYLNSYRKAIEAIGKAAKGRGPLDAPGISIKLSALHPRYELSQQDRVMTELLPRVKTLCLLAKTADIGLTVDAEEADRLEPSLDLIAALMSDAELAGWQGFGLAVQAYQKRAPFVLDWLAEQAKRHQRRLMVRLVKGAYWDSEIKMSQERGLSGYPVFTRKVATDLSYLVCVKRLLAEPHVFYPQFATHNAHSLAAILALSGHATGDHKDRFEFQRLHGMGEALYEQVAGADQMDLPVRIYAPVGGHEDLLAYLVRRLLENGANTSFVNRLVDEKSPIDELIADPVRRVRGLTHKPHPQIPTPPALYGAERRNSTGIDLSDPVALKDLTERLSRLEGQPLIAGPIVGGRVAERKGEAVTDPADRRRQVGEVSLAVPEDIDQAIGRAHRAAFEWDRKPATERAAILDRAADLLEEERAQFLYLAVREAGKTLPDAVAEVREAVDFCRYYALRARKDFAAPELLPGPTGERNQVSLHGRGVFACISPWNFPLAIFTGQIVAALAAGNSVIAKPAEQTPLMAFRMVQLLHRAGVPADALHLLPGGGETVGAALTRDPRIAGVAFTGSTQAAWAINRSLAARQGPLPVLIAETGGQNAMLVDSTALPEQVTRDVMISAFQSAGQRCSALRVLFLQEDIAKKMETMLAGAMAELRIGDPGLLATDVGPVIDRDAQAMLTTHAARMEREAQLLYRCTLPAGTEHGTYFAPQAYGIDNLSRLTGEVFGPILHIVRYQADRLDQVIEAINATEFGLTLGIHSRIDHRVRSIASRLKVGNCYVNRNMIGAVVGVQPFGGEGLSGTGPKAGGPRYLHRFATERTLTIDTTAAGGNASLLSLAEEEAPAG